MIRLPRTRRPSGDSVVPMINVAFLLLIFFLMTAVLAPPDPLDVTPPVAGAEDAGPETGTLIIDAEGNMALGDLRGDAVLAALPDGPLRIRADARFDGAALARILARVALQGVSRVELITVPD